MHTSINSDYENIEHTGQNIFMIFLVNTEQKILIVRQIKSWKFDFEIGMIHNYWEYCPKQHVESSLRLLQIVNSCHDELNDILRFSHDKG